MYHRSYFEFKINLIENATTQQNTEDWRLNLQCYTAIFYKIG